jgi:hypothetical protein
VCKVDKIRKTLKYNYGIRNKDIKLIVNTGKSSKNDEYDELKFRVSSSQNNEFIAEYVFILFRDFLNVVSIIFLFRNLSTKKHKEDWIKAFKKVKNIEIVETRDFTEIKQIYDIGVIKYDTLFFITWLFYY